VPLLHVLTSFSAQITENENTDSMRTIWKIQGLFYSIK